ncbi:MAG: PTS sugar transporter subunit IIC [Erysipelotrichaceae bacterium]
MNSFQNWMENHFVPVAAKIGAEKHLVAVRDAFISVMPITMAGSIAVLLNVFFRDLPALEGLKTLPIIGELPTTFSWLIAINGNVWWGTNAIFALAVIFALGYHLSKAYDVNPIGGGLVAFASLIAVTPQGIPETWGNIPWQYTNAGGLFTALIVGLIATLIYVFLFKKNITIKLPDSVPPAVSKAFAAIIPGTVAIYFFGIVAFLIAQNAEVLGASYLGDLISMYVQKPFLSLSQGLPAVIITTLFVSLFWFFGLHGTNVLAPALDGIYKTALQENLIAYEAGKDLPHIWTRGSFDAFAWMGGAGCTLALILAIFFFSKKSEEKTIAKLSAPMGIFNINEPVMFGVPIVLSPTYFIPFIFVPVILVTIGYAATTLGLISPVFLEIPWIMPPVLYAFLATGGDFLAAGVALFNLVLAVVLWGIFVKFANKEA